MSFNNWSIVEKVSTALNIPESVIVSRTRKSDVVDAKTIIAYKIYNKTNLKLHLIYDVLYHNSNTKQRHCSVHNLLDRYERLSKYDKIFKQKIILCKEI
jgi:hypothetical protein